MNQMNQIIAERAYQAIKEITPQMELDIRNEIRMRYEQELLEYKITLEEKIKQNCQKEIEERVELMHKQTIEEFKRRKKNIEMKERELQNHRQRLQMMFEPEIQAREEQSFKVEKERIMTELLQNIDKNQLVNEVETELKKDILKELNIEKENELKRKETILRLNYKKKYENERAHLEEQIKYNFDNELQKELESIQLQRQMIQSQTQDKHNRIQNLQNEKKQQNLMIQKSKEKFQQMIFDLEKELVNLNKFREQVQQEYASQVPSSTFRRGSSSRHTSPQQSSKIIMSVNQPPLTSTSSQQQQMGQSLSNQTSPSIPATSTKKRQSIQFQQDLENLGPSSRKASPTNRLQNGYTTSQSSLNQMKSKEEVSTQQAQNYLSEQQNTIIEDYQYAQPHQKLDTFNPSETQQHTERDIKDKYKVSQESVHNTEPFDQQKAKDIKQRVSNLLGEIQQNYNTDLKEDIQHFIMQAEKNQSIQKKFQSLPTYPINQSYENRISQDDIQQQNQENQITQQSEQRISYKPSFHLIRKDSSETESSHNSQNNQSAQLKSKEKTVLNQDTFRNLKDQYEQIKKINEQQQQQLQGLPTFKTEPNSLRYNTIGNDQGYYYGSDSKYNLNQYGSDNNKRSHQYIQNLKESMSGEDDQYQNHMQTNRNQQIITKPSNGWYTSQDNDYQTEEDQNEESVLNSSSSTVQLQKELRNPERVRPKEITTEEEMINYILQEKSFPNKKQYFILWKIRAKDSEEDKAIKNIKLTIDCILEEEKEYEPIYDQKMKQFEKEIDKNVKRFSEESWTEDDQYQKGSQIKDKFSKLKYFWKLCDTSFKERIQLISKFTSLFCMMNKLEKEIDDQVEIMDIVRNNPIVIKIGQQLKERQKIREKMINEFCLINYKNHKEDLKMVQEQINMLNNEYQQSDKKGKKTTHARLARNKNNPKQLFWRNIKISDIIKIDKWEELKLQQCLIKLKLQGFK